MFNKFKIGDLVRYKSFHEKGLFVVTHVIPDNFWITITLLDNTKEYVELWACLEEICK